MKLEKCDLCSDKHKFHELTEIRNDYGISLFICPECNKKRKFLNRFYRSAKHKIKALL